MRGSVPSVEDIIHIHQITTYSYTVACTVEYACVMYAYTLPLRVCEVILV